MFYRLLALSAVLASAPTVLAQGPPTCTGAEHRQFDFWAGTWEVSDSSGARRFGSSAVTLEEAGCLLHERWTGAGGGTGQSLNFYDRVHARWEQVWVSNTGNVLHLEGHLDQGAMRLSGESRNAAGLVVQNRIVWIPEPDGRVRQTWLISSDGGQTWQASFDGWYRRAP